MKTEIIEKLIKEFSKALGDKSGILITIVSISYLSSLFTATADDDNHFKDVLSYAVICLMCVPMVKNIYEVITGAKDTIGNIRTVMLSSVPGLCAVDIGTGTAGAAIFITLTQVASSLLANVFLPLCIAYAATGICGSVSDKFSLDGVKNSVKFFFNWGLGIVMIAFSCTATLSGALTGARTSMMGRTLKYTGAMVPVVGRYLAESTDMVFAGASVLRSTAGIAAVTAVITAAAVPCLQMASHVVVYRLAGILIKPVADGKISSAVSNVGDAFSMITGVTILMCVMCVLNISVLVTLVRT